MSTHNEFCSFPLKPFNLWWSSDQPPLGGFWIALCGQYLQLFTSIHQYCKFVHLSCQYLQLFTSVHSSCQYDNTYFLGEDNECDEF